MKGLYILVIFLSKSTLIKVGALGNIEFKKGYYLYVGSAMGSRGSTTLLNRTIRHLKCSPSKKLHWHIDYFLENEYTEIVRIHLFPISIDLECNIANSLLFHSDNCINGFGCSDCVCKSHLLYFIELPFLKDVL